MLICDHCGKMIEREKAYSKYSVTHGVFARNGEKDVADLCADCMDELKSIVTKFVTKTKSEREDF